MEFKTEKQFQAHIIKDFHNSFPEHRGMLFSIDNNGFGARHGQSKKSMGMQAGVSDLMLILDNLTVPIELKLRGSRHDKSHVRKQVNWMIKSTHRGCAPVMIDHIDRWEFLKSSIKSMDKLDIRLISSSCILDLTSDLDSCTTKTIKIDLSKQSDEEIRE